MRRGITLSNASELNVIPNLHAGEPYEIQWMSEEVES